MTSGGDALSTSRSSSRTARREAHACPSTPTCSTSWVPSAPFPRACRRPGVRGRPPRPADGRGRAGWSPRPPSATTPTLRAAPATRRTRPGAERRLAAVVSGVALVGAHRAVAVAAQNALPGDALYPVKRGLESAHAGSPVDRGDRKAGPARQRRRPASTRSRSSAASSADHGRDRQAPSTRSPSRRSTAPTCCWSPTTQATGDRVVDRPAARLHRRAASTSCRCCSPTAPPQAHDPLLQAAARCSTRSTSRGRSTLPDLRRRPPAVRGARACSPRPTDRRRPHPAEPPTAGRDDGQPAVQRRPAEPTLPGCRSPADPTGGRHRARGAPATPASRPAPAATGGTGGSDLPPRLDHTDDHERQSASTVRRRTSPSTPGGPVDQVVDRRRSTAGRRRASTRLPTRPAPELARDRLSGRPTAAASAACRASAGSSRAPGR